MNKRTSIYLWIMILSVAALLGVVWTASGQEIGPAGGGANLNRATGTLKAQNAPAFTGDVASTAGSLNLLVQPAAITGRTQATGTTGDFLLFWDASASALRKLAWADLPGSGGGISNGFASITDGTTSGDASGADTFKLRTANGLLTITVGSNDMTHGDNALFTINQASFNLASIGGTLGTGQAASAFLLDTELDTSAELAALLTTKTGSGLAVFGTSPTLTTPVISGAVTWPAGVRQIFAPNGTNAGLNVGDAAGQPGTLVDGDLWYDSTVPGLFARTNGQTLQLDLPESGQPDAYMQLAVNDETPEAVAEGADTLRLRSATNRLSLALADNDPSWGDHYLFSINEENFDLANLGGTLGTGQAAAGFTLDAEWDTEGEVQTKWGGVNILLETEIDASVELALLMDDEIGSGNLLFGNQAVSTTSDPTFDDVTADTVEVTTEAYDATAWNGDLSVPTKDAIRDKIESMGGGGGGGADAYLVKTTTYTAVAGERIAAKTGGGAWTLTLPSSPSGGDCVWIADVEGTFDTANLTVARNGQNINGSAANLTLRTEWLRLQLIYVASDGWRSFASSREVDVQVFTSSGTWYKPARAVRCQALMIGGGGGGGAGRRGAAGSNRYGGGGGGGAGCLTLEIDPAQLSSTESVTVGAGGTAGTAATGNDANGGNGGDGGTSIYYRFKAMGGNGGTGGTTSTGTGGAAISSGVGGPVTLSNGGAGGTNTAAGVGSAPTGLTILLAPCGGGSGGGINASDTRFNGGNGGGYTLANVVNSAPSAGAAGGSTGANGGAGTAFNWFGTGAGGGASGDTGGSTAGGSGAAGTHYGTGGGGGGASTNGANSGAGGAGGAGLVIVTTFCN